ncbi:hypothetical protein L6452_34302 [Arctium lappa]|uniref:Uncharacterized protein n=1 Tax=Arctium lappa TaxID=4217 RepID=A0ACB8YIE0_ARCLA|nr:hypothetical protein L6452_34302 [Arctium lappa]
MIVGRSPMEGCKYSVLSITTTSEKLQSQKKRFHDQEAGAPISFFRRRIRMSKKLLLLKVAIHEMVPPCNNKGRHADANVNFDTRRSNIMVVCNNRLR